MANFLFEDFAHNILIDYLVKWIKKGSNTYWLHLLKMGLCKSQISSWDEVWFELSKRQRIKDHQ